MFELVEVTSNKSSYERYIDQNLVFSFSRPATMEIWSVHGMISHCSLQKTQQTRYFSTSTNVHLLLQTFNMVVEIPRFSQAKFEINREWPLNPIRQDVTSVITGNEQRWTFWRQKTQQRAQHYQVPAQRFPLARTHLQLWGSSSDLGKPISPG